MPSARPTLVRGSLVALLGLIGAMFAVAPAAAAGGTVSGTVTAAVGGAPLSNIDVFLMDEGLNPWTATKTNAQGQFSLALDSSMPTGQYTLAFHDFEDYVFASEYLGGSYYYVDADYFAVTNSTAQSGKNAQLDLGAFISGSVVTEESNEPLTDVYVWALATSHDAGYLGATDEAGEFSVGSDYGPMPPGSYELYVEPFGGGSSMAYLPEYYNDVNERVSAETITVAPGATHPNVQVALTRGATFSGTVVADGSGDPVPGVYVEALDDQMGPSSRYGVWTDEFGEYVFSTGLAPGDYRLYFDASVSDIPSLASEYHGDAYDWSDAAVVTFTGSENVAINIALAEGGEIAGTISAPDPSYLVAYPWRFDEGLGDWLPYPFAGKYGEEYSSSTTFGTDAEGDYLITGLPAGDYRVQFVSHSTLTSLTPEFYDNWATIDDADDVVVTGTQTTAGIDAVLGTAVVPTGRIAGNDRYATAAAVAAEFDLADTVYVANGTNYPDALSAAPAAAYHGAPLLLTDANTLPAVIAEQIERLTPARIVVVGGTSVVSSAVEAALESLLPGTQVERIAGENRYETSRLVTDDAFGTDGAETAFIATGTNFPDALAASAAAAVFDGPVILVNGAASTVDDATLDLLDDLGVTTALVAGGTAVVSPGVLSTLDGAIDTVTRLAGADRYSTSVAINNYAFGLSGSTTVYLAVGTGFADALAGAALAGANKSPLFVVPGNCVPAAVLDAIEDYGATRVQLFGGTGVLSAAVENLQRC
jgi:putative cell wall-binding protein